MAPWLQALIPQHALSAFGGYLANSKIPWLKNYLIRYFVNRYPVNLTEAVQPDPYQYASFNEFFIRKLKPDVRPISSAENAIVCPADGCISQLGHIKSGKILQAKSHFYSIHNLLGDVEEAHAFLDGSFLTVYLAPQDYHRVHMPCDGKLTEMMYVPGKLFSVNDNTAAKTADLFARNERVISFFDTEIGKMALVLVGAMIVGSIETPWAGTITPPRGKIIKRVRYSGSGTGNGSDSISLKRGEEMGRFKLGSTVIVVFEPGKVEFEGHLKAGQKVLMGQNIGSGLLR